MIPSSQQPSEPVMGRDQNQASGMPMLLPDPWGQRPQSSRASCEQTLLDIPGVPRGAGGGFGGSCPPYRRARVWVCWVLGCRRPRGRFNKRVTGQLFLQSFSKYFLSMRHMLGIVLDPGTGGEQADLW